MKTKKYIQILLAAIVTYIFVVGTVNIYIDPYDTFFIHSEKFHDLRKTKSRIYKANHVVEGGIDVAVLGSSRPEAAFEEAGDFFPNKNFYNVALQDTSLKETERVAQLLFEYNSPKVTILGAEFDVYNFDHLVDEHTKSLFSPTQKRLEVILEQALSFQTLKTSIEMIKEKRGVESKKIDPSMKVKFEILLNDSIRLASKFPYPLHYSMERWSKLSSIKSVALNHGSRVYIILMPVHATVLTVFEELGYWTSFENWKRDLISTVGDDVEVWDFTGYADYQTEAIPAQNDANQKMGWYNDPSHCNKKYGQEILNTIFGNGERYIGTKITKYNIDEVEKRIRSDQLKYHQEHPKQVKFVKDLISKYKKNQTNAYQN
jgi:hypothetical protein